MMQKSRVLQIRGVKGKAVAFYCKPFTTKSLRHHRLSLPNALKTIYVTHSAVPINVKICR